MANRLKMAEHQAIIGLVRLRWSYRRIAAELGIDRQTVSRHVKAEGVASRATPGRPGTGDSGSNAAIPISGSPAEAKASAAPVLESNAAIVIAVTGRFKTSH